MNTKLQELRITFQAMSKEQREEYLRSLSKNQLEYLYRHPDLFLFDKQIIEGEQRYTILRCGRRFGKTVAGSAWIVKKIINGAKSLGLCGATHEDVLKVMVPAIKSWFPYPLNYNQKDHTLTGFKSKAIVHCFSSDNEIRGYGLESLWCDEVCNWCQGIADKIEDRFKVLDMAVSAGANPQTIITSTPKEFPLFFKWQKQIDAGNPNYQLLTGSMFDNPFLSDSYKQAMLEECKGRFARRELYGELLTDVEGAAWSFGTLDACRIPEGEFNAVDERGKRRIPLSRTVVCVDPSVSDSPDSDECGITVAALGQNNHVYLLQDLSGQYTTDQWAEKAVKAFYASGAGCIVIEKNNGGELVRKNLQMVDPLVPIKTVTATRGKIDRALPVAALYERSLVHHVMPDQEPGKPAPENPFAKLEAQMTGYSGKPSEKSPDRLDSMVWAVYELRLNQTFVQRDVSNIGFY